MKAVATGLVTYIFEFEVEGDTPNDIVNIANLQRDKYFPRQIKGPVKVLYRTGHMGLRTGLEGKKAKAKEDAD